MAVTTRSKRKFVQTSEASAYSVVTESMSVDEKLKVLQTLGRGDLIEIFKNWEPRQAKAKRRRAPLDQKVAITVTNREKIALLHDLQDINRVGEVTTVSAFVRNRALGNVDINGWREIAEAALGELQAIEGERPQLLKRLRILRGALEVEEDGEEVGLMEEEISSINMKLSKVAGQSEARSNRLSGRMTMAEAETVKWRAARLCLSTSDYLRFMIFNHLPYSAADAHMSIDSKKRFYISIIDVAVNGWGDPPTIAHCVQCQNYLEEIQLLKDRLRQLETFV